VSKYRCEHRMWRFANNILVDNGWCVLRDNGIMGVYQGIPLQTDPTLIFSDPERGIAMRVLRDLRMHEHLDARSP